MSAPGFLKEHVRTDPWSVAGRGMERVVGGQPALSCPSLRADSPPAPASTNGRRHDVPFFHGGIHDALDEARKVANGMDVRIGGGANTIQQYLRAGLIDEMHFAICANPARRGRATV
jgi:hypothetical protein